MKYKLIRITTIPESLKTLLEGQLRYMNQYFEVIGISSNDKILKYVEEREGIRTIPVEMTRKITILKDIRAVYLLYKIFRHENPQIVHTHTPKAGIVGMLSAWLARVPWRLHTVAGLPLLETGGLKRKLLDFVEKITYACATNVYPNSFKLNEIIVRNNYIRNANKLKVIANGSSNGINILYFNPECCANTEKEKLRSELKIAKLNFIFLFVGRLVKDKGINELIGAFKEVHKKHNETKLLLVGNFEDKIDPLLPDVKNEIFNNLDIIWVGYQDDVRRYFAISDILVFPSYREGFPNVVMQAGAMGLPYIVTDVNGCNEIIADGLNGIIIPSKNRNILKDKMELLLENTVLRNNLRSNARKMIISRYEQNIVWNALLEEYQTLIHKNVFKIS
jgi:glycosyltransferase involved in cell wall biosynthesis